MNRPTRFSLPRMICVWTSTTLTENSASMACLDLDLVGVERDLEEHLRLQGSLR